MWARVGAHESQGENSSSSLSSRWRIVVASPLPPRRRRPPLSLPLSLPPSCAAPFPRGTRRSESVLYPYLRSSSATRSATLPRRRSSITADRGSVGEAGKTSGDGIGERAVCIDIAEVDTQSQPAPVSGSDPRLNFWAARLSPPRCRPCSAARTRRRLLPAARRCRRRRRRRSRAA